MPWKAAAAGIGGVASIIGGILGGRAKTTTSTVTPSWTPEMQQLQDQLKQYSSNLLTDPSAGMAPIQAANQEAINRRYASVPDSLSRQFASRGYGSSGNFGSSLYNTAYARAGDTSNLNNMIAQATLAQKNQGASLADQLLQMNRIATSKTTGPGTSLQDAFMSGGNALMGISQLYTLQQIMKKYGQGNQGGTQGGPGNIYANASPFTMPTTNPDLSGFASMAPDIGGSIDMSGAADLSGDLSGWDFGF
jgi:hypothetical protein